MVNSGLRIPTDPLIFSEAPLFCRVVGVRITVTYPTPGAYYLTLGEGVP